MMSLTGMGSEVEKRLDKKGVGSHPKLCCIGIGLNVVPHSLCLSRPITLLCVMLSVFIGSALSYLSLCVGDQLPRCPLEVGQGIAEHLGTGNGAHGCCRGNRCLAGQRIQLGRRRRKGKRSRRRRRKRRKKRRTGRKIMIN